MRYEEAFAQARAIALAYPCYLAVETAHPRFGRRLAFGSLLLTINTGYE